MLGKWRLTDDAAWDKRGNVSGLRSLRSPAPGIVGILLCAVTAAAADGTLLRQVAGAEVDFAAGVITVRAGAAADTRLPRADLARPKAERQARAAATTKLRAALAALSLSPGRTLAATEIEAAVGRAQAKADYQSNGGVLLALTVRFEDLFADPRADAKPEHNLTVAAAPLDVAPVFVVGGQAGRLRWAVYKVGTPPSALKARAAKRDDSGRLVVRNASDADAAEFDGARAVIWVQKPSR